MAKKISSVSSIMADYLWGYNIEIMFLAVGHFCTGWIDVTIRDIALAVGGTMLVAIYRCYMDYVNFKRNYQKDLNTPTIYCDSVGNECECIDRCEDKTEVDKNEASRQTHWVGVPDIGEYIRCDCSNWLEHADYGYDIQFGDSFFDETSDVDGSIASTSNSSPPS